MFFIWNLYYSFWNFACFAHFLKRHNIVHFKYSFARSIIWTSYLQSYLDVVAFSPSSMFPALTIFCVLKEINSVIIHNIQSHSSGACPMCSLIFHLVHCAEVMYQHGHTALNPHALAQVSCHWVPGTPSWQMLHPEYASPGVNTAMCLMPLLFCTVACTTHFAL